MAEARPRRADYPVGVPLRPPPGWKGKGATVTPLASRQASSLGSLRGMALKVGLVAAMVVVCMGVGWLAVGRSRGPSAKSIRSKVAPEPIAKTIPSDEPKADLDVKPAPPEPAKEPPPPTLTYERDILPILERSCLKCHDPKKMRGELDLSTLAGLVKGGEGGTGVKPGKPTESPILTTVLEGKMPPSGKKLHPRDVQLIREWIQAGARGQR